MWFVKKKFSSLIGHSLLLFSVFGLFLLMPAIGWAYVGPGLGAGAIGVILGVIAAVSLALFAIIWYPIKRLIKKIRGTKK